MPELVIVSVFYNRQDFVHESVKSVVDQLEENQLLLLIDDGSSDATFDRLKEWEAPNVEVRTHANKGFVSSIREAIASVDSQYVAIHGSGDISLPTRFRKQLEVFRRHPEVGVVGVKVRNVKASGKQTDIFGTPFHGDASALLEKRNLYTQGEVMFRRDVYDLVGGYREFFKYSQDRDLWCRMSVHTHFHTIDEVLYQRYKSVPGGVSGSAEKRIVQQYLSAFAVYCHRVRRTQGYDPLERDGPTAILLMDSNEKIRKELFNFSLGALSTKRYQDFVAYRNALANTNANFLTRCLLQALSFNPALSSYLLGNARRLLIKGN